MGDNVDRTDEYRELIAEDERRASAIDNGQHPDDPGLTEPPEDGLYTLSTNTATLQHSQRQLRCQPLALLRRILDSVADEIRSRGLVGEEQLAQTLYLVLTSRLLDKQVSAGVKGHSASGKSYTVETVTKFFPPEAYLEFTAMSERALVYSPERVHAPHPDRLRGRPRCARASRTT